MPVARFHLMPLRESIDGFCEKPKAGLEKLDGERGFMLKATQNTVGQGLRAGPQGTKCGFTLDESGVKQ
jgi:hypothetical protein